MKFDLNSSVEILERTPGVLHTYLSGLSKDWVQANEGPDTWSPFDIVGHLIHGEKTDWIPRLKIILNDQLHKPFDSFDRYAQFENSKGKSLEFLLEEFSNLRNQNLTLLKSLNLTEEDLNLKGVHPELGQVSLRALLATWVTHDLGHIAQISRVMAKQYRHEVGPWLAYISILNEPL